MIVRNVGSNVDLKVILPEAGSHNNDSIAHLVVISPAADRHKNDSIVRLEVILPQSSGSDVGAQVRPSKSMSIKPSQIEHTVIPEASRVSMERPQSSRDDEASSVRSVT